MSVTRRGFLNLLGIAGVVAAARPAVSLFGSDEEPGIIVPDRAMVAGHFVVKPKRMLERIPESEREALESRYAGSSYGMRVVGRIPRHREPTRPHLVRPGSFGIRPEAFWQGATVQDAHAEFYVASHDMRERFAAFTRETLSQVDPHLRAMATVVTIVDAPIHARPKGMYVAGDAMFDAHLTKKQDDLDREERGFDVVATFRQFVVLGARRDEISTFEVYSEHGEYPVDIPKDIEMGMLIKMDREVVAAQEVRTDRVAGLLSRFSRSWKA